MLDGIIFPNNPKEAKITPVFKAGDSYSGTNYRPISWPIIIKLSVLSYPYKFLKDF